MADPVCSYICCSLLKRESIVRMVTVSQPQKNNSNQQQDSSAGVSLVLVSAKGRVAVYDSSSLKPSAPAFTLRLSPAPVASIKASTSHHHKPLLSTTSSSNGAAEEGGNTAAAGAAPAAAPTSSATTHNGPGQKTHLNGWITDCVHMDDCNMLVVASSERSLHFFTTVVIPFAERFRLDGMKDIPTSLGYMAPDNSSGRSVPVLGVGDDGGDVFILRFLKSSQSLFKRMEVDREIQHVYWRELHLQAGMVTLTILHGSHDSPVLQVDLKQAMQRVASCSKNPLKSLAVRHIRKQSDSACLPSVTLRSGRGITCFDYDEEKGLLVSGSSDGKIRLWSPTHLAKPWMVLKGHTATIAAVCLLDQGNFMWSLCDHSELRHWDLNTGRCIRTIRLEFTSQRKGRVQFSQRPLLALDSGLFIACGDSIATVRLNRQPSGLKSRSLIKTAREAQEEAEKTKQGAESKIPIHFREGLLEFGYRHEDDMFENFVKDLQKTFSESEQTTQRLKELKSLENELKVEEDKPVSYEWEEELFGQPPASTHLVPLNLIKLKELDGQEEMKRHVREGTPFCGLKLVAPKRIELPAGLPVTDRMRKQGIKEFQTLDEVRRADFDLFTERMVSLSSQRTSLASSIMSYYRQKNVGDRVLMAGDSEFTSQLHVSRSQSQNSSRNSSLVSSLSVHSPRTSIDG